MTTITYYEEFFGIAFPLPKQGVHLKKKYIYERERKREWRWRERVERREIRERGVL